MSQMSGLDNPALLTVNRMAIREIQLDAMKEGMRRAAKEVEKLDPNMYNETEYQFSKYSKAILTAAEQLTMKGLDIRTNNSL